MLCFQIPPGVKESDWSTLASKDAVSSDIAESVVRIIECLRERLKLDSPTYTGLSLPPVSSIRRGSSKKIMMTDLSKMNTFVLKSPSCE